MSFPTAIKHAPVMEHEAAFQTARLLALIGCLYECFHAILGEQGLEGGAFYGACIPDIE